MKNFNKKIYAINRQTVNDIKSNIPSDYFKMATKIANSYSKDYSAIGVMNINDLNNLIIIKTYNFCFKMSPMNYLFLVIFHRFQYTL